MRPPCGRCDAKYLLEICAVEAEIERLSQSKHKRAFSSVTIRNAHGMQGIGFLLVVFPNVMTTDIPLAIRVLAGIVNGELRWIHWIHTDHCVHPSSRIGRDSHRHRGEGGCSARLRSLVVVRCVGPTLGCDVPDNAAKTSGSGALIGILDAAGNTDGDGLNAAGIARKESSVYTLRSQELSSLTIRMGDEMARRHRHDTLEMWALGVGVVESSTSSPGHSYWHNKLDTRSGSHPSDRRIHLQHHRDWGI